MKRIINTKRMTQPPPARSGDLRMRTETRKTSRAHPVQDRWRSFLPHVHQEWQAKDEYGEWIPNHYDHFTLMTRKEAEKWMRSGDIEVLSDEFQFPEAKAGEEKITAKVQGRDRRFQYR